MRYCSAIASLLLLSTSLSAEVKLSSLFSDNMVVQQGVEWNLWGKAAPGESVAITVGGQTHTVSASAEGRWSAKLPALPPGGPFEITVSAGNTVTIKNVLAGEVWLASGQSNMAMPVSRAQNYDKEKTSAEFPTLRMFRVKRGLAPSPADDVQGSWEICTPATVGNFSAAGYFFARELIQTHKVAVGVIDTSFGGKRIQYFMQPDMVKNDPQCKPLRDYLDQYEAAYPAEKARYERQKEARQKKSDEAQAKLPPLFVPPTPQSLRETVGAIYNAMIAPVAPYTIRGVIWYQGEGNSGSGYLYRDLFPEMIRQWRKVWGQGDSPFLFVQLAAYKKRAAQPEESGTAEVREAQLMTLATPNTAMALATDIGDADDIHPKNKQEVGHRLALAARAMAYGEKIVYSGPIYESMNVEGDKVRIRFRHVGGGLVAKDGKLAGFAIADESRKYVWAQAVIDGDTVVISCPEVAKPVAVSYAWGNNPECSLYNKEGLPASPFRTDSWPRSTQSK